MKRFARGALTLAFWVAVWTALALLVNRELLLPAPWVVVRRLCELAATAWSAPINTSCTTRARKAWLQKHGGTKTRLKPPELLAPRPAQYGPCL